MVCRLGGRSHGFIFCVFSVFAGRDAVFFGGGSHLCQRMSGHSSQPADGCACIMLHRRKTAKKRKEETILADGSAKFYL